ncbi:Ras family protein [Aphelenchoides fujianensis]|nr:Ras family protein [Aphelenchoides fujianensis]KAI6241724.1 Ras family protein [Aphelenchoides fujianensis]
MMGDYTDGFMMNETNRDYHHLFKILLIGNSGVGKSSLLLRFADNVFQPTYITTIGVDFKIRTLDVNGKKIKLQIWDTAGQERFRTITSTYYRGTHGVIVVYDLTNSDTFRGIKRWLDEIERNCESIPTMLVANKLDNEANRAVVKKDGEEYAICKNCLFCETSARTGENVEKIFEDLTRKILESDPPPETRARSRGGIRLTGSNNGGGNSKRSGEKKKSCRCN